MVVEGSRESEWRSGDGVNGGLGLVLGLWEKTKETESALRL